MIDIAASSPETAGPPLGPCKCAVHGEMDLGWTLYALLVVVAEYDAAPVARVGRRVGVVVGRRRRPLASL